MDTLDAMELIDLSVDAAAFTFPGDPPATATGPLNRVTGANPEYVYDLALCSQSGTHVQGPHYFMADGRRIDAFGLEAFCGRACVVDAPARGRDTDVATLRQQLPAGPLEVVLLRTGHMDELAAGLALEPSTRPGLSGEAARYLAETRGVRLLGIDSVGLESLSSRNYEVNRYLCERGVLLLEGLVGLHRLPRDGAYLEAFPLKLAGVEGTPCRAVARVPRAASGGGPQGPAGAPAHDAGTRLGRVVVLVRDYDEAAAFYRDAFGFETLVDQRVDADRRYLHLGLPGQPGVGVWLLRAEAGAGPERVGRQTGGEPLLVLYTPDCDAFVARFRARGGRVVRAPVDGGGARYAHLLDLYGNEVVVVEVREAATVRPAP